MTTSTWYLIGARFFNRSYPVKYKACSVEVSLEYDYSECSIHTAEGDRRRFHNHVLKELSTTCTYSQVYPSTARQVVN